MTKAFIDTNILLDYLLNRDDFVEDARNILLIGNAGFIIPIISDLSIANIAYITRNKISQDAFFSTVNTLQSFCKIAGIGERVITQAVNARWNDFEDSLQYFAAMQAEADCIITRNVKDFQSKGIPVLAPHEFLDNIITGIDSYKTE